MGSVDLGSSPNWGRSLIAVESVEELAKKQLTQVPERYVKSDEERPAIFESPTDLFDSEKNNIVIDMSKIAQEQYRKEEIRKMAKACEEWGFFQDDEVVGLQIHKDDQWRSVKPIPYALVINTGNMTEVMTNGRYKSIVHRAVTNKEKERLSIGLFTEEISPSPELIDDNHPCLFRKFIHQDYLQDYYTRGTKEKKSFYEFAGIKN